MMKKNNATFMRFNKYIGAFHYDIIIGTMLSVISTIFDILPEILIGFAIDIIVYQKSSFIGQYVGLTDIFHQFILLGVITFFVWVIEAILEYAFALKWRRLAQKLQHQLRIDTYKHLQSVDVRFFDNAMSGNLVSILNDDINQLERFFDNGLHMVIHIITSTLLVGAIFLYLSPQIALLTFAPIPFIIAGVFLFQRLLGPEYDKVRAKAGELNNRFMNNLHGITTIKSYAAEKFEVKSLIKHSNEYQTLNQRAIRLSSLITPATRIIIMFGYIASLLYGGYLSLNHTLSISEFTVLVFLSQRLLWPITYLGEISDLFYRAMASMNRILNLLDAPISITSGTLSPAATDIKGQITFSNLSFSYEDKKIIHDLTLTIPEKSKVAFVGGTGTGKSTLVKLLMRFYDPTAGAIYLDNRDLKELHLESLRRNIGYVSQDVFLFNGTVADNIAYGSFSSSREEVEAAAKVAEAHDFIMKMPDGYQTKIGERGMKLSGGQKQRLSIARAVLKNPPILILDEATSAVDNETEAAIQQSLEKVMEDRTTIIIAHRLNTIRNVDKIYVLEHGKIIEQGNHATLLDVDGTYAWLWQLQTGDI